MFTGYEGGAGTLGSFEQMHKVLDVTNSKVGMGDQSSVQIGRRTISYPSYSPYTQSPYGYGSYGNIGATMGSTQEAEDVIGSMIGMAVQAQKQSGGESGGRRAFDFDGSGYTPGHVQNSGHGFGNKMFNIPEPEDIFASITGMTEPGPRRRGYAMGTPYGYEAPYGGGYGGYGGYAGYGVLAGMNQGQHVGNIKDSDVQMGSQNQVQRGR